MCKVPVKSTTPTNQHLTFYSLDALPIAQPIVSRAESITFYGRAHPKLNWGLPSLSLSTKGSCLPCLSSALRCQYSRVYALATTVIIHLHHVQTNKGPLVFLPTSPVKVFPSLQFLVEMFASYPFIQQHSSFIVKQNNVKLESALCGDANPRRLQRQSCCG